MKVICIMDFVNSPISTVKDTVIHGNIYTVKDEHYGYSTFAGRYVYAYEFYEIDGYYEKGIFIPLSDIDELNLVNKKDLNNFVKQLNN